MPKKVKKAATSTLKKTSVDGRFAFANLHKYTLIFSILLLLILFLYFISPFFAVLIISAVIAIDLAPFNNWLTKKVKFRGVASFITTCLVLIVGITPLIIFGTFVVSEAITGIRDFFLGIDYENFALTAILPEQFAQTRVGAGIEAYLARFTFSTEEIAVIINDSLASLTTIGPEIFTQTTNFFKQIGLGALYALMFIICLFYFLYDGAKISENFKNLLPIPVKYKDPLFSRLNALSKGIIYGIFGAALVQGLFGGIGFYFAGIHNAAFWGTMMAIFSPVPYVGPAIVWIPMVLFLVANGSYLTAIFIAIWGAVVVSTVDNLVKPYLIGKSTAINPLLVLLTLIGGVLVFGVQALIYAPFLLTLLLSLLHIYQLEYKKVLEE